MRLIDIAEDLKKRGKYGPRSDQAGCWRWNRQLCEHLKTYLLNIGVDIGRCDTCEQQRVWSNMREEVEWLASSSADVNE